MSQKLLCRIITINKNKKLIFFFFFFCFSINDLPNRKSVFKNAKGHVKFKKPNFKNSFSGKKKKKKNLWESKDLYLFFFFAWHLLKMFTQKGWRRESFHASSRRHSLMSEIGQHATLYRNYSQGSLWFIKKHWTAALQSTSFVSDLYPKIAAANTGMKFSMYIFSSPTRII